MMSEKNHKAEHSHDAHQAWFDEKWEQGQQNPIIKALRDGVELQAVLESAPGFHEAFLQKLDVLDCSDGRIVSGNKMGLPSSGLLSVDNRPKIVQGIKELGIKTVTGHENCGAAALAFPGPDSDSHGYEYAESLAADAGVVYKEVRRNKFREPNHSESCLVVEGTGRFNCANWPDFPTQFIDSSPVFNLPDNDTKNDIFALTNIALGDHSFGARFDATHPFFIMVSANNQEQLERLMTLSKEAVAKFGDRVQVKGFVAPAVEK